MSNSKIAETVRSAAGTVPSGYTGRVDAVIAAVEGLAEQVASALVTKGVEMGGNEGDIRDLLVEVGLVEETPEPEAASGDDETPAWAERLVSRIDALEAAARRAGVRV